MTTGKCRLLFVLYNIRREKQKHSGLWRNVFVFLERPMLALLIFENGRAGKGGYVV